MGYPTITPGGHIGVGQGHTRGLHNNVHRGGAMGHHNGGYQRPGYCPQPRTVVFTPQPRTVVVTQRRVHSTQAEFSPRAAAIATLIGGIALTILGLCMLPFEPVSGSCVAVTGVLLALAGGAMTPFVPWRV